MKKRILVICLFLGACTALAEQSGFFIGGGVGIQGMSRETKLDLIIASAEQTTSARDASVSLLLGYKSMSDEKSGSRFYLNYDYNGVELKDEGGGENKLSQYEVVGLNADYLFSSGLFIGVNVGVIKWGKDIWSLSPSEDSEEWKLYVAGQAGLRGIFGESKSHSVELGVKVPFTSTTIEYKDSLLGKVGETKLRQSYNVSVRYIYTF